MAEIEEALEKLGGKAFDFTIAGHSIQSHLLNVREELSVDRLTKDYEGTMAYPSALKTATFALSVDLIDDSPFFQALEKDSEQTALARFKKAQNFYRAVIQAWFEEYEKKAEKEAEALENLKKKSAKPSQNRQAKS
jgi:hypothetical protein